MNETKTCSKCREEKPTTAFHKNAQTPDGLHRQCRTCRGTKMARRDAPPTEIREDFAVWQAEFAHVCTCIACGGKPELPNEVTCADEARGYVFVTPPTCTQCRHAIPNTRARLKAKQWHRHAEDRVKEIDVFHLITCTLRYFPHERKRAGFAAKKWLAGDRTDIPNALMEHVEVRLERAANRAKIHQLNELYPILTPERIDLLAAREPSLQMLDSRRAARAGWGGASDSGHPNAEFVSLVDLVHLEGGGILA